MKEPVFSLKLSELNKILLDSDLGFKVISLKVEMPFHSLSKEKLKLLEEYADVVDGKVVRWILVPSMMPLNVLAYTISRAFGLMPMGPWLAYFKLAPEDMERIVKTLGDVIDLAGAVFEFLPDVELEENIHHDTLGTFNCVPSPPYEFEWLSYEGYQGIIKSMMAEKTNPFIFEGKEVDMRTLPFNEATAKAFDDYIDIPIPLDHLLPSILIPYILQTEGKKLYDPETAFIPLKKIFFEPDGKGAKPFVHRLILEINNDREAPYKFTITRPKDVREIIDEGYLDPDKYINSCRYVASEKGPDCICQKGFDLFGFTENDYYDFVSNLNGPDSTLYRAIASSFGWREPGIDLKKILR